MKYAGEMIPTAALWIVPTVLIVLVLGIAFVCFYMAFYSKREEPREEYPIPPGKVYEPYREQMKAWMKEMRELPHDDVYIRSFDGLTLHGRYYEHTPGALTELMLHGYRGNAERDLCGGVQRAFALGRNVLIVDQRGCGESEGHVITFGICERHDCRAWVDYLVQRFGKEQKIFLTGISMGASTVLMTGAMELPENVVGVLCDCGYSTAREIIKKTIREMHLPVKLAYPFVKLGAWLYGGFRLEETSPLEAAKCCSLPVIFIHGEGDDFVPCDMSRENYRAKAEPKALFTVPGAGHGLCYLVDPEGYLAALRSFEAKHFPVQKNIP